MSRPFAKNNGKTTFEQFIEPLNSSEYTLAKKYKSLFCPIKPCIPPNKNIYSQNNYLSYKIYTKDGVNPNNFIDTTALYINLITKINLEDVVVVSDLSGNIHPVKIDTTVEPYLKYNIDPSGNLFGNTVCGINNFENYVIYNNPIEIKNQGNISNL
jgi:hypothetical protein